MVTAQENRVIEDDGDLDTVGDPNTLEFQVEVASASTEDRIFGLTYELNGGQSANGVVSGPSQVVIPANQTVANYSVTTVPNGDANDDMLVIVRLNGPNAESADTSFTVEDNDSPRLSAQFLTATALENGPATSVTIARNTDTTDALTVTLDITNSDRLNFDGADSLTVDIPAGQTSVTVELDTVDDEIDNGNVDAVLTASAANFVSGTDSVQVIDNDAPELTIEITSTNIVAEDAGADAVSATVSRNSGDLSSPLTVNLSLTGDDRLDVQPTVTIPAGQRSVDVTFDAIDNNIVNDQNSTATITASSTGFTSGEAQVTITDDDSAAFTITPDTVEVDETAGTTILTFTRNSSVGEQTVDLNYSDTTLVNGPSSVTFADGDNIRTVQVTIIDNDSFAENADVTVTATSAGNSDVTATIIVNNDDILNLTTDFTSNSVIESVDGLITKDDTLTITGQTTPGARVQIDSDGDAAFDEGSDVADQNGNYSITLPLVHDDNNNGVNPIQVRATLTDENIVTTSDITNIHRALGTVVRFEINQDLDFSGANDFFDVELLDSDTPRTVNNFLSYVNDGSYENLIAHRSPANFVVQGGGFTVEDGNVTPVTTRPAIENDFNSDNPNTRGTLSMAQLANMPDSGTSQWFFNVVDNLFLNDAMHTVFGDVIAGGMSVIDNINSISIADLNLVTNQTALGETPVVNSPFTALSGTVALTADSNILTGTGTQFTTDLQVGDVIEISGSQVVVTAINSDTEIQIDVEANGNQSGLPISLVTAPPDSDYVIFTNIGEILDQI